MFAVRFSTRENRRDRAAAACRRADCGRARASALRSRPPQLRLLVLRPAGIKAASPPGMMACGRGLSSVRAAELPAIFVRNDDGTESLVNFSVEPRRHGHAARGTAFRAAARAARPVASSTRHSPAVASGSPPRPSLRRRKSHAQGAQAEVRRHEVSNEVLLRRERHAARASMRRLGRAPKRTRRGARPEKPQSVAGERGIAPSIGRARCSRASATFWPSGLMCALGLGAARAGTTRIRSRAARTRLRARNGRSATQAGRCAAAATRDRSVPRALRLRPQPQRRRRPLPSSVFGPPSRAARVLRRRRHGLRRITLARFNAGGQPACDCSPVKPPDAALWIGCSAGPVSLSLRAGISAERAGAAPTSMSRPPSVGSRRAAAARLAPAAR